MPAEGNRVVAKLQKFNQEQYDKMLAAQGGVCAICGKKPGKTRLARDHDHVTGEINGLLHVRCNHNLGAYEYDTGVLRRLVIYVSLIIEKRERWLAEGNKE